MSNPFRARTGDEQHEIQDAIEELRELLGSYNKIAARCYAHTGTDISSMAIRRWFIAREVPLEWAIVLTELALAENPDTAITIYTFYPGLAEHLNEYHDFYRWSS